MTARTMSSRQWRAAARTPTRPPQQPAPPLRRPPPTPRGGPSPPAPRRPPRAPRLVVGLRGPPPPPGGGGGAPARARRHPERVEAHEVAGRVVEEVGRAVAHRRHGMRGADDRVEL